MNDFINFLNSIKTPYNTEILDNIQMAYNTIYEGSNDLKFVFNTEDWIDRILHKINTNNPKFKSSIVLHDIGFECIFNDAYKNVDLHIKWIPSSEHNYNMYDPENNIIWILFSSKYNKSNQSLINIVNTEKDSLLHELRHWYDHITYDIEEHKYTKISQLENKSLKNLGDSVFSFSNDKYINLSSELNAHICEFIHIILNDVLYKNKTYSFDDMYKIFTSHIDMNGITNDSKKRIQKRLYVFSKALDYLYTIRTNSKNELKRALISYIDKYTGIVESIDYTHTDILNKRNIVFFEANYSIDTVYKSWFDSKYVKNNNCISTYHLDAYNRIQQKI
jgi:hypothetical protein